MRLERPHLALVFAPLALLAGCHGHGNGPVVVTPLPVLGEQEPNDTSWQAQGVGPLGAWDGLEIVGQVGFGDTDGFAFQATSDIEVFVSLDAWDPFADLDLCVWDPYLGQYVLCLLTSGDEYGSFTVAAGYEFHLVVDAFFGSSSYALVVETEPVFLGYAGDASDGGAESPGLGAALLVGGELAPSAAGPVRASAPGERFGEASAERRAGFERYLEAPAADESARHSVQVVAAPGLPGSPLAVVPMLAPVRSNAAREGR